MRKITKNQHFVPRCLLKNFTNNIEGSELVNIYDSTRNKLRSPTTVDRVLSENYFYDKDNSVENYLAKHIEGPASKVLKKFKDGKDIHLDIQSQIDLLKFITVQFSRTPTAISKSLSTINNVFNGVFEKLSQLKNYDEETINALNFNLKNEKDILRYQTIEAAGQWPLIFDLEWHFLINNTYREFIISDHPVINYNWYLRDVNALDTAGITKRGIQIFLPLSKAVTLCLYDKAVYKMGKSQVQHTYVKSLKDIDLLNELQFRNRKSYIVFTSRESSKHIESQCNKIPSNSLFKEKLQSEELKAIDNETRFLIAQGSQPYKFDRWLSFCKIKNKFLKEPNCNIHRNQKIVYDYCQYIEK